MRGFKETKASGGSNTRGRGTEGERTKGKVYMSGGSEIGREGGPGEKGIEEGMAIQDSPTVRGGRRFIIGIYGSPTPVKQRLRAFPHCFLGALYLRYEACGIRGPLAKLEPDLASEGNLDHGLHTDLRGTTHSSAGIWLIALKE